jgi:predicted RNase H-like HicB family nuclease
MKAYFALVHHEDEKTFGIQFPDWPGVFSASDTETDLIANAAEALQLAAEDGPIPAASSHSVLVARDDIRTELSEGAFLIAVPFIENDTVVERANVTFERGLLRAIDAAARRRKTTRAGFLAIAARNEIEQRR